MTKYVRVGATVQAHEVTDANLDKLADQFGGTVHVSVRDAGARFATFESTEDGTLRVNVGGFLVTNAADEVIDGFSDPQEFHAAYERP